MQKGNCIITKPGGNGVISLILYGCFVTEISILLFRHARVCGHSNFNARRRRQHLNTQKTKAHCVPEHTRELIYNYCTLNRQDTYLFLTVPQASSK